MDRGAETYSDQYCDSLHLVSTEADLEIPNPGLVCGQLWPELFSGYEGDIKESGWSSVN